MNYVKEKYLQRLQKYIDEPLYVKKSTDELDIEIDKNCWWINGTREEIQSLTQNEWIDFIKELISNRKNQLLQSGIVVSLQFYCWHDLQAGQLRFNVINNNHPRLPFGGDYELVSLEKIVSSFLADEYYGSIPRDEFEEIPIEDDDFENDDKDDGYVTKVYREIIEI